MKQKQTIRIIFIAIWILMGAYPIARAQNLTGYVYDGNVGDTSTPISGVTVTLWVSNNAGEIYGTQRDQTTTAGNGSYSLNASGASFDYYNIVETDPTGYTDVGALSAGGTVKTKNHIQHVGLGGTLTGNNFWDKSPLPTISIGDESGNENCGSMGFTVTLSAASASNVTVGYQTNDGTAVSSGDYTSTSGTLTIPATSTTGTISVTIIDDTIFESTETFTVYLSNATNATISDNQGIGTILDNDDPAGAVDDYGDVPVPYAQTANYSVDPSFFMGQKSDPEFSAQPDPHALGDDNDGNDDEDGVVLNTPIKPGQTATLDVTITNAFVAYPKLEIWIDFNRNYLWDLSEKIVDDNPKGTTTTFTKTYTYTVPNIPKGMYFVHAVFYSLVSMGPPSGEVEDHEIVVGGELDFGDAPTPYPDASHMLGGHWMGDITDAPDAETGMQRDAHALGDDNDGNDDEDGLINYDLIRSATGTIKFSFYTIDTQEFTLAIWVDFNGNMDWDDPGEKVWDHKFSGFPNVQYWILFHFPVPSNAVIGKTQARFRIYYDPLFPTSPSGYGGIGEVCDHEIEINEVGEPLPEGGVIFGYKWNDLDGDGSWDTGGEPPLSGWTIWLDANQNGVEDAGDRYTHTDASGEFMFTGLNAGHYLLAEDLQLGWRQTFPVNPNTHTVTVDPTKPSVAVLFGNTQEGSGDLGTVKWLQPPLIREIHEQDTCYWGWLETSINFHPMYADDWFCYDPHPVTAIRWWGGYADWDTLVPPPQAPEEFHIGVWSDVPKGVDGDWSHPGELIFEWMVDRDSLSERARRCIFMPEMVDEPVTGFEYIFQIPQEEWFYQEEDSTVYWLSITAVYETEPDSNQWGWLTREHYFHDDAVRFYLEEPVFIGVPFGSGEVVEERWDFSFELGTDVYLREFDYGDSPEMDYSTLLENNGAHHRIVPGIFLGETVDWDADGQPLTGALGDDNDGQDDEDGVRFTETLTIGDVNEVTVIVSTFGFLNAWLDIDRDGNWVEPYDHILRNVELNAGENTLSIDITEDAEPGETMFRFRFSTEPDLWFNGFAMNGEVEDYAVTLQSGTSVHHQAEAVPSEFMVYSNYPNPFNPVTSITFAMPIKGFISLEVFSIHGKKLTTLIDGVKGAGLHKVQWNGKDDSGQLVSSGIYLCRMKASGFQRTIRMLLLK